MSIEKARSLIKRFKEESGSPGLAITVSRNGKVVWSEGFGYSDVENDVPCTPNTVMRIASISKPLTATAASKDYILITSYCSSFSKHIWYNSECFSASLRKTSEH